jgi:hypothetical protein
MGTWSGLSGLREIVEPLRPRLRVFRDERGRELLDLPDAPRPDPDTPAPARFLPEFDNLVLSHADRSRVVDDGRSPPLFPGNGARMGSVLVDGRLAAIWRIALQPGGAVLTVEPFTPLGPDDEVALEEEGRRLLVFVAGDVAQDVRIIPAP